MWTWHADCITVVPSQRGWNFVEYIYLQIQDTGAFTFHFNNTLCTHINFPREREKNNSNDIAVYRQNPPRQDPPKTKPTRHNPPPPRQNPQIKKGGLRGRVCLGGFCLGGFCHAAWYCKWEQTERRITNCDYKKNLVWKCCWLA